MKHLTKDSSEQKKRNMLNVNRKHMNKDKFEKGKNGKRQF